MRNLKTTLTFRSRATGEILCETISYFIPGCGDSVNIKTTNGILNARVYEREFRFEEDRVILIVNVLETPV